MIRFQFVLQREIPIAKPPAERLADVLMGSEDTEAVELALDVECETIEGVKGRSEIRFVSARNHKTGQYVELTPDEEAEVIEYADNVAVDDPVEGLVEGYDGSCSSLKSEEDHPDWFHPGIDADAVEEHRKRVYGHEFEEDDGDED